MAVEPQSPDRILAQICELANARIWPVDVGKLRVKMIGAALGHNLEIFVEGNYGTKYNYRVNDGWNQERGATCLEICRISGGITRPLAEFAEADIRDARKGLTKIMSVVMANATARYKDLLRKVAIEKATKVRRPPVPPVKGHKAPYTHKER